MNAIPDLPFINHQADGDRLVMDLCRVPDEASLVTARFFEDAATKLRERHKVWQRQQAISRETKRNAAATIRMPGRVLDQMLAGHDYETAVRTIADRHGFPRETVHHYWLRTVKEVQKTAIERRNDEIFRLYRANCTDMEIADMMSLSDRHVRRIIHQYLSKERQPHEPPDRP